MNGNSEGYFAYGFTLMKGVTCVNAAGDQLVIDVSEMGDPDRAWGFFVTNRDQRSPVERIGSAGQVLPRRATFAKGRHYAEIAASPDKDHREPLRAFVTALEARVPGGASVPDAVAWFPAEGLEPGSIRLVPESVLGLRLLKSGFLAQYAAGRAFVVPEATPEAATATMAKLRERFAGAGAGGRSRGRGVLGAGPVPRPRARLPQGRAGGRRRQRRRGRPSLGAGESARGRIAVGPRRRTPRAPPGPGVPGATC